jgi:tRNA pseudouridine55 synthase
MATGLLLVMVGRATRLSDYLLNGEKAYLVKIQFGLETDTLDMDGTVVSKFEGDLPCREDIVTTALSMSGVLSLQVPEYSAVKVDGKKLYEHARKGEPVPVVMRDMRFDKVEIVEVGQGTLTCRLDCAKGSYIRAWSAEIGKRLGCGAVVTELRRLLSAPYFIEEAIPLDDMIKLENPGAIDSVRQGMIPLADVLRNARALQLTSAETISMLNGKVPGEAIRMAQKGGLETPLLKVLGPDGSLLAVLEKNAEGFLKIGCVLKTSQT